MSSDDTQPDDCLVRQFDGTDLSDVMALWERSMPEETVSLETVTEHVLLDPNFDRRGCLVTERNGELVGFVLGLVRKTALDVEPVNTDRAWISLLFVHPDHRRDGIGRALVKNVEEFARSEGRTHVRVSNYLPYYFFPGPDTQRHAGAVSFFSELGFETIQTPIAMAGSIAEHTVPESVRERETELEARENVRIEPVEPEHVPGLIEMVREHFSSDWVRSVRTHLRTESWDQLFVATRDSDVVGWCQFGTTEPGRFGPYGVAPEERGNGIGTILFHTCLNRMRAAGIHSAWLLWTDPDGAAADVYRSVGFSEFRQWAIMERTLESE